MHSLFLILLLSVSSCSFLKDRRTPPSEPAEVVKKATIQSGSSTSKKNKKKVEIAKPEIRTVVVNKESYFTKLNKNIFNAISQNFTFKYITDLTAMDLYKGEKDNAFIPSRDIKDYDFLVDNLSKKQLSQLLNNYSMNKESFTNATRRMLINNERIKELNEFKKEFTISFFLITLLAYLIDPLVLLLIAGVVSLILRFKNKGYSLAKTFKY